jgi:ABC-type sugar transport system ATPase subunit
VASVHIRNVHKHFGHTHVIRGVDVDIADGEFAVLVGPSGCGKSTLLRMIAGLEEISTGEIEIGGRIVNRIPPKERDIAMVFQNYALYPHMKVRDNMAFSLMLAKRPRSEIDARVAKAAAILGLDEFLDRYPRQLSGGQRQRVAMGRAIVRDPQVFLFDEPLSNLDAKLRRANGRVEVELEGGSRVPAPHDAAGEDGQPVIYGTRPEHLALASPGQGLPVEVVVVEPTGADTQVFAKIGATEITAVFRERHEFRAGEAIRLAPDHERTHLFDAASGKSLRALG